MRKMSQSKEIVGMLMMKSTEMPCCRCELGCVTCDCLIQACQLQVEIRLRWALIFDSQFKPINGHDSETYSHVIDEILCRFMSWLRKRVFIQLHLFESGWIFQGLLADWRNCNLMKRDEINRETIMKRWVVIAKLNIRERWPVLRDVNVSHNCMSNYLKAV